MDFESHTVKFSNIKENEHLAELYSKIYDIPKQERVKVLMSWLANAYSDLLIPFLPETEVLATFITHIKLLDSFANNSTYEIVAQLASEFSENFVISQIIPNLLENYEKTADVTYYIQVMSEHLTCPTLIKQLMSVVSSKLTPILIIRMGSDDSEVASATLSLIKCLLEFYCEDLWYDLILQYLLPMKHHLTSQRQKMLPEIEFQMSTHKFLDLIPRRVSETISISTIAEHFYLYFEHEVNRLRAIDMSLSSALPFPKAGLHPVEVTEEVNGNQVPKGDSSTSRKPERNPTYPMWIFRYDGTDFLHALRRGYLQEEPEEFFEDDLFSVANQLNSSTSIPVESSDSAKKLSRSQVSNDEDNFDFASVSVQLEENGDYASPTSKGGQAHPSPSSLGTTPDQTDRISRVWSIVQEKKKSIDSLDDSNGGSYFGPFLHALHAILKRWTSVDPKVLFTATEVVSVLASSRIPLVNVLFLDMSLMLQPSYPSFSGQIYCIRHELDEYLAKYPDTLVRNAWNSASKESSSVVDSSDSAAEENMGFVDKLQRTIDKTFRMATDEVQRTTKIGRSNSFRAFTEMFKSQRTSRRSSDFRLLNRATSPFGSDEEERAAKLMAMRCVLFSHWMLELGAIAVQLCWGRRSFRGNHQQLLNFPDDDAQALD